VGWRSLQRRFEETIAGRVVISIFIVVTLLAVLTANLPVSRLQDVLLTPAHRYIYATGLDQSWGVFSPDPRRQVIHLTADVTFADGTTKKWEIHKRNSLVGAYVDYRWLKWQEFVVSPGFGDELGRPLALYVARRFATPAERPVKVVLTNHYYALSQPGIPQPRFVQTGPVYSTSINPDDLRGSS
jgi:hypothetical protein